MVTERVNARIVTEANLLQQAISTMLSKKARASFTKQLESLTVESIPSMAIKALSDPEDY